MDTQKLNKLEKLERARAHIKEVKGFYSHLAIYLIFVCVFATINIYTGGFWWAVFPIVGWGIGVVGHSLNTFHWNPFLSKDWEQRKIDEMMQDDNF